VKQGQKTPRERALNVITPLVLVQVCPEDAAASQRGYWEMHDLLFDNQHLEEDFRRYAERLGLDPEQFDRKVAQRVHARRVRADLRGGLKSGVEGTSTFFVNDPWHDGTDDLTTLRAAVKEAAR